MRIDIQTLKGPLKTAAEDADRQGSHVNGYLDADEVSAFIEKGREEGCSMTDLLEIAKKVVPEDSPFIQQAIAKDKEQTAKNNIKAEKQNEIFQLEEQIRALEQELKDKKDKKEDMWADRKWVFRPSELGHFALAACFAPGCFLLGKALMKNKRVLGNIAGTVAGIIGTVATEILLVASDKKKKSETIIGTEYNFPENYQDSVQYNRAEEFRKEEIVPLERRLVDLRCALKAKQEELAELQ